MLTRVDAFTLVELLVVMGVMLVLTVMTIGAVNLSITSERTRGAARQVQSLLEGGRDRAIYAAQPRGIRILVNEQITEDVDFNPATPERSTLATTLVYIGSPGEDTSESDIDDIDSDGDATELFKYINVVDPAQFPNPGPPANFNEELSRTAIIGVNTRWSALFEQGLIGPGTVIRVSPDGIEDARQSSEFFTIDPRSFPVRNESFWFGGGAAPPVTVTPVPFSSTRVNGNYPFSPPGAPAPTNDEVLFLTYQGQTILDQVNGFTWAGPPLGSLDPAVGVLTARWSYVMETNPDVLPGEEPSILPRNTCIDLQTSHLPEGWLRRNADGSRQYSSRMDLLFAPNGTLTGRAGSAGLIHLHICDVGDAIANVPPGSQTVDGTPTGEPRNGDEFGITIFTRAGRVNVHPINWSGYPVPATESLILTFDDAADFDGNPSTKGYWQPNAAYGNGDIVAPRIYNGLLLRAVSAGTTGGGDPDWNLSPGSFTADGGVTWVSVKHNVWALGVKGEVAK